MPCSVSGSSIRPSGVCAITGRGSNAGTSEAQKPADGDGCLVIARAYSSRFALAASAVASAASLIFSFASDIFEFASGVDDLPIYVRKDSLTLLY